MDLDRMDELSNQYYVFLMSSSPLATSYRLAEIWRQI